MSIERIERALEIARLQRARATEQLVAAASPPPPLVIDAEPIEPSPVTLPAALRIAGAPAVEFAAREVLRERYVVFPDEPGVAAQAYKMLRTQVLQRTRQHAMRCVGVISAASGEGKSVTAINLALSLAAESTQSVVLVDLDLRRPSIARTLGIEVGEGDGVEAVLTTQAPLSGALRRSAANDRIGIVPAAAPVGASSELLAGPRAAELFRELRAIDGEPLVLVDLPPALLSDDVLALAPLLDGVVLVVTEERTRREDVQRVFDLLRNTPVIGTVLNASADAEKRAY
ncbi:MAG TPA: CpsD/CapB family tyrosine-protein kinase [Steroidobacteraceae bacterium]|nr:CpsD/CapB family tyrosine-protein kinase [Steroidobacteraceae bacterium]